MRISTNIFDILCIFFLVITIGYGISTQWDEPVGLWAVLFLSFMNGMIGVYLHLVKRGLDGELPEDRENSEIAEGAGTYGFFPPWSWWPIVLAGAIAIVFLGLAIGWWIAYIGGALVVIGLVGWVFEYYRGIHAH